MQKLARRVPQPQERKQQRAVVCSSRYSITEWLLLSKNGRLRSNPEFPVQRPVLDRLADVGGIDVFRPRQVGDRAGDFEAVALFSEFSPLLEAFALD